MTNSYLSRTYIIYIIKYIVKYFQDMSLAYENDITVLSILSATPFIHTIFIQFTDVLIHGRSGCSEIR